MPAAQPAAAASRPGAAGARDRLEIALTIAIEVAFFAVFAAVVLRFLRRPSALNRDVLATFASVAGLFVLSILSQLVPGPDPLSTLAAALLVAQPYLTVRLVRHFGRVPAWLVLLALLGFLASAALVVVGITGNRPGLFFVVAYFVTANTLAAVQFVRAAQTRVGAARSRLLIAGLATFLLGLAVLIIGIGMAMTVPGQPAPAETRVGSRVVALLAGVGYLFAFLPPRWIRRVQQQAIAFELDQGLLGVPAGSDPEVLWSKLAAAGRSVTGARLGLVVDAGAEGRILGRDGTWDPGAGPALGRLPDLPASRPAVLTNPPEPLASVAAATGAETTIIVPVDGATGRRAALVLFVPGSLLFVDDDVALLSILASRTVTGIEREEALAERSRLVATLQRANDELARASAAKSDFLAAMSHELRTPLNSIIGFSELLMAPTGDDGRRRRDVVDQAGYIHSAGLQLLDLINEVLDLARIEAGRLDLHLEPFDLTALVRTTAESMTPLADRRDVRITVEGDADLEVEADPARVRQIVYNLLSNAIKFSPKGGAVAIRVGAAGNEASVAVADEGPGIPPSEQALVFEAFSQGAAGRRHREGAGLGLALSRQLAETHGGRIELVSQPPAGSTFTLVIPVRGPVPGRQPS